MLRMILGTDERGKPTDPPLNHATGKGYVKEQRGDYYDAIKNKNNMVLPLIVETTGGFARHASRCLAFAARRAKDKKRGRDSTRYSATRPTSFKTHHVRTISHAAVFADTVKIKEKAHALKARAFGIASHASVVPAAAAAAVAAVGAAAAATAAA